jgi:predicted 3-demethylubiquinone-9 3-methyltransferase (glyoxalase superfamily)
MTKLSTFLWFDTEAEEAMNFYLSIFRNGKRGALRTYPDTVAGTDGKQPLQTFEFELDGMPIIALNAGPTDGFNERVSLHIETKDQAETDYFWNALIADGGEEKPCGWLTDKFGVYWQVEPSVMPRLLSDSNRTKAERALKAMYKLQKIVIADLEKAFAGKLGLEQAPAERPSIPAPCATLR